MIAGVWTVVGAILMVLGLASDAAGLAFVGGVIVLGGELIRIRGQIQKTQRVVAENAQSPADGR